MKPYFLISVFMQVKYPNQVNWFNLSCGLCISTTIQEKRIMK